MKMFKRIAAAVLVGVMALAVFTACSSAGTTVVGAKFEDQFIKAINTAFDTDFENDNELRVQALKALDKVNADGTIAEDDAYIEIVNEDGSSAIEGMVITEELLSDSDEDSDVLHAKDIDEKMVAELGKYLGGSPKGRESGEITRVGVGTKAVKGKTYAAYAFEITIPERS